MSCSQVRIKIIGRSFKKKCEKLYYFSKISAIKNNNDEIKYAKKKKYQFN